MKEITKNNRKQIFKSLKRSIPVNKLIYNLKLLNKQTKYKTNIFKVESKENQKIKQVLNFNGQRMVFP